MPPVIQTLISSRRFWAGVAAIVVIVAKDKLPFPVTDDQITNVVMAIGAWIVGESLRSSNDVKPA